MSKPQAGTKYTCEACGARFYDLNRTSVICFKCGTQQSPLRAQSYHRVRRPLPGKIETPAPVEELAVVDGEADDDEAAELEQDDEVEIEVDADDEAELG